MLMNNIQGILVLDALKGYLTRLLKETGHNQKVTVTYWAENTAGVLWTCDEIRVRVPQVDESKTVSRSEFMRLVSLCLHEIGHVNYTSNSSWDIGVNELVKDLHIKGHKGLEAERQFFHGLINGLEDVRMELEVINRMPNVRARDLFEGLIRVMVSPVAGDDFKNIPFALACLGRRLNGYEFEFDWDWAQVPWYTEMQKALADNANARSTTDTVEVARTLYDALLKYRKDEPQSQSEEQSEENQDEQEQSEEQSEDSQESGEQEGSDESKEGEGSEGEGEKKEGGEESGEGQESNEVGEDTSEGSSEGSEGSETKQGKGNKVEKEYSLEDYPETEVIQVEPQGQAFDNGKVETQHLCNEIDPNKEVRDLDLSEGVAPSKPQGYGATRNALWRLLKADDEVGVSRKELKGKVDRKNLVNLNLNSPAVFSQRDVKEAENTAFQIFLDISGSMRKKDKAVKAGEVTEYLCDIVNSTDATLNVTGFFGSSTGANMVTFKDWAKAYNKDVKKRVRHLGCYVGGGTPLYESLHWAIKDTAKQANAKKVVCVITDCEREFSQAEADYLENVAKVSNVKLFMIGVDANTDTIKMFKRSVSIDNARDLFGATFNKLINELSRER